MAADRKQSNQITIFDKDRIIDKSTYELPGEHPEGIEYVIVNGSVSLVKDELTRNRSGKVLRGPAFVSGDI